MAHFELLDSAVGVIDAPQQEQSELRRREDRPGGDPHCCNSSKPVDSIQANVTRQPIRRQ